MMVRSMLLVGLVGAGLSGAAWAADSVKLSGTRFEMEVPKDWAPGYKDLDDKLLMVYLKDPSTGATLEGVYLRKVQPTSFSLDDFKKWRIEAETKRYEGKHHAVNKEDQVTVLGDKANYLITEWAEGDKKFEKHTVQYLKDGRQYMIVLHGPAGKVNTAVLDHAVKTFALGKE